MTVELPDSQAKFVAALLDLASETFSNHGCNDLDQEIVSLLSEDERRELQKECDDYDNIPEGDRTVAFVANDASWMSFFANKLRDQADKGN